MADLEASAVSVYPTDGSGEFFPYGKDNRDVIGRRLKLVLTGQGSTTNKITASALGFTKLLTVTSLYAPTEVLVLPAAVDPINNIIVLGDLDNSVGDVISVGAYLVVTGTAKLSPPA